MKPVARTALRDSFGGVETWVFDLDNTLYPPHSNLFAQVDRRMGGYIAGLLGVELEEARRLQKTYYREYGTTMRGLMLRNGIDPHEFLAFVHDIDHSPIEADPALGAALALLPGRKLVLTNGSRTHAETVLGRLGIAAHFEDLFDIIAADFEPKPARGPYERFLARHGIDAPAAAMFEDLARNLEVPHALGMRTVLVTGRDAAASDMQAAWEREGRGAAHVGHVTDDLARFLADIAQALGPVPGSD